MSDLDKEIKKELTKLIMVRMCNLLNCSDSEDRIFPKCMMPNHERPCCGYPVHDLVNDIEDSLGPIGGSMIPEKGRKKTPKTKGENPLEVDLHPYKIRRAVINNKTKRPLIIKGYTYDRITFHIDITEEDQQ